MEAEYPFWWSEVIQTDEFTPESDAFFPRSAFTKFEVAVSYLTPEPYIGLRWLTTADMALTLPSGAVYDDPGSTWDTVPKADVQHLLDELRARESIMTAS